MRLVTFEVEGQDSPGVLIDEHVVDLARAYQNAPDEDTRRSAAVTTMRQFLELGEPGLDFARSIVDAARQGDLPPDYPSMPLDGEGARLRAPILDPGKILCTGLNYREHAAEAETDVPAEWPFTFCKLPENIRGPGDSLTYPAISKQLDAEIELAVVIGRTARNVSEDDALSYVAGYTIGNDLTARDVQFVGGVDHKQFFLGKNCEGFTPLGPCIVTTDEIADPQTLHMTSRVNGEVWQDANTGDMVFPVKRLVSFYSQFFPLRPGDILFTGTPGGVGLFREPPTFLEVGDVLSLEIEGIGVLENPIVAPSS